MATVKPVRVGILGTGNISKAYAEGCGKYSFLNLVACADIRLEAAQAFAETWGVEAMSVDALLADPSIDVIINLTVPAVHAEVSTAILEAGKHVYLEKPLATSLADGMAVMRLAEEKGLRVGCAPDTFLGGGIQTARKLIDDGAIGEPVGATAFFLSRGMEHWHPNPTFFYQPGGGPMLDMGPYYLTALVNLLGPITEVAGKTRISFPERVVTTETNYGQRVPVNTPTYMAGLLNFASGPIGTIITTFDVYASSLPRIEIYGSEGSLSVPDPNWFGGPVQMKLGRDEDWQTVPHTHRTDVMRGIGLADMMLAIQTGRPHRASGALALHVLEMMLAFEPSSANGRFLPIANQVERPAPLPTGLAAGELDA